MSVFDHDEQMIRQALAQIKVDAGGLTGQVKSRLTEKKVPRALLGRMPRLATMAAALMIVLLTAVTAAALTDFEWFQEKFNPSFGAVVEPVEVFCEDQGIRMEVIGAQTYDNKAIVYLSLQDISGQNRLTERTDFRDGFDVKMDAAQPLAEAGADGPDTMTASIQWRQNLLYFDEATNTIYYEYNLAADANSPLADPLELVGSRIYFDTTQYENEPLPLALTGLAEAQLIPIGEHNIFGFSANEFPDDWGFLTAALAPGYYAPMPHGADDQWISNIGMVDGKLHVQIGKEWQKDFGSSDLALQLRNTNGDLLGYEYALTILCNAGNQPLNVQKDDSNTAAYAYDEFVFDVAAGQLADYTLCFSGSVSSGVEGRWRVAAHLSDTSRQMRIWTNEVAVEGYLFEHLTLSPLGLHVTGSYEDGEASARTASGGSSLAPDSSNEPLSPSEMPLALETAGGLIPLEGGGGGYDLERKTFNLHWNTAEPLDVATVTAVIINGVRIPVE